MDIGIPVAGLTQSGRVSLTHGASPGEARVRAYSNVRVKLLGAAGVVVDWIILTLDVS
jgi:hypothetical protein